MTNHDHDIEIEYCYDIVLVNAGDNQAKVIGLIRQLNHMNISVKEVKSLLDNLPCVIADCVRYPIVNKWKHEFESIGATVELKEY